METVFTVTQHFQNKPSAVTSYGQLSNCNAFFNSVQFAASAKCCWGFSPAMSTSQDPMPASKPIVNTVVASNMGTESNFPAD